MEVAYSMLAGVAVFVMIRLALLSSKDCTDLESEYQRLRRELGDLRRELKAEIDHLRRKNE